MLEKMFNMEENGLILEQMFNMEEKWLNIPINIWYGDQMSTDLFKKLAVRPKTGQTGPPD